MKALNVQINTIGLNRIPLSTVRLDGGIGQDRSFGGYQKKGLLFQLDCTKGITSGGKTWTDLIKKFVCQGTAAFTVDEGVTFDGTNTFSLPTDLGDGIWVEICQKASGSEEIATNVVSELPTALGSGFSGVIYSVRVYNNTEYSDSTKAKNAAIDEKRFGMKQFTLDESALDSNDWLG